MVQPPLAGNKFCFPRLKPLKRADFAASEVRRGLPRMFKDIDLEDPQANPVGSAPAHCIVKTDRADPPTRTARF
jgi:hypothetical protein